MKNHLAKILVCSSDQSDQRTLANGLGQEYQFQEVSQIGEAMRQCLMAPVPYAVLVNYSDAAFEGRNFIVWMKSRADTSMIPAIVVYDSELQAKGGLGFLDGASDYVTRPFNLVALDARLRTLTELAQLRYRAAHNDEALSLLPGVNQSNKHLETPHSLTALKKIRVLLVDDSEINREIAKFFLAEAGFEVDAFDGTDAAFDSASSFSYDIILTDLNMPGRDGYEFSKALRELPGYSRTPILAMTASAIDEVRKGCLAAGIDGHIEKPVDPEVMLQTIRNFLAPLEPNLKTAVLHADDQNSVTTGEVDSVREVLASVNGLDYDVGISRLGSKDLYTQLLGEFLSLHSEDMVKMARYLENSCKEDALRLLHTLKGLAATLGLSKLQNASGHLELGMHYEVPASLINLYVDRISELMGRLVLELRLALKKLPSVN